MDKIENGYCKKIKTKLRVANLFQKQRKCLAQSHNNKQRHLIANTFDSVREDAIIQSKVEQCLQELTDSAKTGKNQMSQRGENVEVMVKNRIKRPHEYVCLGLTKNSFHTTNCRLDSGARLWSDHEG